MSKKMFYTGVAAVVLFGAVAGAGLTKVFAEDSNNDAAALAIAGKLGITAYEPEGQAGGGGAPQKVLLDNAKLRVNLVSFPAGYNRPGKMKRRNDQLLIYIDQSDYTITWNGVLGEAIPADKQKASKLPPGSAVFHPKDSVVSDSHIGNAYRVIFVEIKK